MYKPFSIQSHQKVSCDIDNMNPVLAIPPLMGSNRQYPMVNVQPILAAHNDSKLDKQIGAGTYGNVIRRDLDIAITPSASSSSSQPPLIQAIQAANTNAAHVKYVVKKIPHTRPQMEVVPGNAISEFAIRNLVDPTIVSINAVEFLPKVGDQNDVYVDTQISMDIAAMDLHALIEKSWDDHHMIRGQPVIFAENELRMLAYQMIHAVAYLHSQCIIHGDIKSYNFLVYATDAAPTSVVNHALEGRPNDKARTFKIVKLADFGMCVSKYVGHADPTTRFAVAWRAPERYPLIPELMTIDPTPVPRGVTPKCDIWALGCVLYELVTATTPIECTIDRTLSMHIADPTNYAQFNELAPNEGKWALNCHNQIYDKHTHAKAVANECPAYPGYYPSVVRPMLAFHPSQRAIACDILQSPYFTTTGVAADVAATLDLPLVRIDYPYDQNSAVRPSQVVSILAQMQAHTCPAKDFDTYIALAEMVRTTVERFNVPAPWETGSESRLNRTVQWAVRMQAMALICDIAVAAGGFDYLLTLGTRAQLAMAITTLAIQEAATLEVAWYSRLYSQPRGTDPGFVVGTKRIIYEILKVIDCDVRRSTVYDFAECFNQLDISSKVIVAIKRMTYMLCVTSMITQYDSYTLTTMCLDFVMNNLNHVDLTTHQANWWYPPSYPTVTPSIRVQIEHCFQQVVSKNNGF